MHSGAGCMSSVTVVEYSTIKCVAWLSLSWICLGTGCCKKINAYWTIMSNWRKLAIRVQLASSRSTGNVAISTWLMACFWSQMSIAGHWWVFNHLHNWWGLCNVSIYTFCGWLKASHVNYSAMPSSMLQVTFNLEIWRALKELWWVPDSAAWFSAKS